MPKSSTNPFTRHREMPSPLKLAKRRTTNTVNRRPSTLQDDTAERLDDIGVVLSLAPRGVSQDVHNLVRYIHAHMWSEIPDRAAGMGSERISEVLRFRQALPRIVSTAHLHALSLSITETERELARLMARGAIRKVVVPGRGKGGAAVGEGVVLAEDWQTSVRESNSLTDDVKEKYIELMNANPASSLASTTSQTNDEVRELVQAGYLISPSALSSSLNNLFAHPDAVSSSVIPSSGSKAATGTLNAVGGSGAVHESGGGGSTLATKDNREGSKNTALRPSMTFSLPSTGPYLKLLTSARLHLLNLIKQHSPRYKEATISLLEEKWDGNIPNDAVSRAKRARGDWTGVLPGKTKKWKDFYGLEFKWVLEECVGSGLVELFDTGSVGLAVRIT